MSNQELRFRAVLSRRDFIKTVVMSGVALATAGLVKLFDREPDDSVLATSGTGPYYYGTDTAWAVDTYGYPGKPSLPQNFFIGRTGVGELKYYKQIPDPNFSPAAADKAGCSYTHTYWVLKGPYYKYRGGRSCYDYGRDQAAKAADAWWTHDYKEKIGGKTIFADIEDGTSTDPNSDNYGGWIDYSHGGYINVANNRAVLEGFLDGIKNYTGHGYNANLVPGVYSRFDLWQSWFGGASYDPRRSFVVWLAGGACAGICSPCLSCTTTKTDADNKFNSKKGIAFGKYKTVIWQFYVNSGCADSCADYNIARQNGYIRFLPVMNAYLPLIRKSQPSPNPYP